MAKKQKNQDSIDIKKDEIENKNFESKIDKKKLNDEPIYVRYKIPIISSIYKIKNKYFLDDKKKFYSFFSLIMFALFCSLVLIICGILWVSGVFGGSLGNNELIILPALLMALGVCILVVV